MKQKLCNKLNYILHIQVLVHALYMQGCAISFDVPTDICKYKSAHLQVLTA